MSLLTTSNVATYLGIDSSTPGLQEAIDNAEAMVAGKLRLQQLEQEQHTQAWQLPRNRQQIVPRHGPITQIDTFTVDGNDRLSKVTIDPSGWAILLEDFRIGYDPYIERIGRFKRFADINLTYTAGWTTATLPTQVAEYIKAMVGLTLDNFLASGVYDTKLGDMTIKIQREVLQKNLQMYEPMLRHHTKPFI